MHKIHSNGPSPISSSLGGVSGNSSVSFGFFLAWSASFSGSWE